MRPIWRLAGSKPRQSFPTERAPCCLAVQLVRHAETKKQQLYYIVLDYDHPCKNYIELPWITRETVLGCGFTSFHIQIKENRHVNYHLGLREECVRRLGPCGPEVYEQLNRTYLDDVEDELSIVNNLLKLRCSRYVNILGQLFVLEFQFWTMMWTIRLF